MYKVRYIAIMWMVFERLLSHPPETCEFLDNEDVGR